MARGDARPLTPEAGDGGLSAGRIGTLAALAAVSPLATGMVLPALPRMAEDLTASAVDLQLTTTAFLGGLAVGQLVIGAVSDHAGRRRPLLVGTAAFVLASIVCAIAPAVPVLVAARAVQGFGGAAGIVLGRAVVADVVDGAAAARAFSLLMTIGAIGPVAAPLLGGVLLDATGWRGVLGGLAAIGGALLLAVAVLLPETLPPERRRRARTRIGLLDAVPLLRSRSATGSALALVLAYAALIGYVSASPFVLQVRYGLSPGQYATVFATNALGLTAGSFVVARVVRRLGPRPILRLGLAVQSLVSLVLLALALTGALPVPMLLVLLFLFVASLSLITGNATALALADLSGGVGSASAVLGAVQFGLAAAVAPIVGIGGADALIPMTAAMAVAACSAAAAHLVLSRRPASGVEPCGRHAEMRRKG